jgi:hypothetical protein
LGRDEDLPLERALAIVAPPEDHREDCRKTLKLTIDRIAKTPLRGTTNDSRQLAALADALRDTHKAIEGLGHLEQIFLLLKPPFNRPLRNSSLVARDITAFLKELDQAAVLAAWQSKNVKVRRHNEGRRDRQKFVTADCAYWLLLSNGKRPTLTIKGPFLELASALYEAATGKNGVEFWSYCRSVSAKQKQK